MTVDLFRGVTLGFRQRFRFGIFIDEQEQLLGLLAITFLHSP